MAEAAKLPPVFTAIVSDSGSDVDCLKVAARCLMRSAQIDPFGTVAPSESGHSRGRFDYEHPRLLGFPTFDFDRRIPLGIVES